MILGSRHPRFAGILALLLLATLHGDSGQPPPAQIEAASEADLARLEAEARRAFDASFYAKAETAARELLAKTEARYGTQSARTAVALDLLVQCSSFGPSQLELATRRLAERAVELRRRLHGDRDPRYALSLCNYAVLLEDTGAEKETLPLLEESLAITERALGPNHPQVAVILANCADHFRDAGETSWALECYARALAIHEASADPDTLEFTMLMNRMAITLYSQGDYVAARNLYDRILQLREARYGLDHPRVTGILNNLASLLKEMGDTATALEMYERVLESLRRTVDDPDDPRIGVAMLSVAALTRPVDPERALPLSEDACARVRKRSGDGHPMMVTCLHGLGCTHRDLGQVETAIDYFEQSIAAASSVYTPEHWRVAFELRHLAALHYDLGQVETARDESQRALTLAEKAFGGEHPEIAEILGVLAAVRAALGDTAAAVDVSLRAEEIATAHLRLMTRGFAEREALSYAVVRPHGLDLPLRVAAKGTDPAQRRRIWDGLVRGRALVLDAMAFRSRSSALADDAETMRLLREVRRASTRLAALIVSGPASGTGSHLEAVNVAQRDKDAAERALAARGVSFRGDLEDAEIGLAAIESSLPQGAALVAFAEYEGETATGTKVAEARAAQERRLLAFVLDTGGEVHVVPIGSMQECGARVQAWIREAAQPRATKESLAACSARGASLRQLIWDPLASYLGDAKLVFIVPEGGLHRVNFAALPLEADRYLLDTNLRIHLLTAERDVVAFGREAPHGEGILVLGGADFDALPESDPRLAGRDPAPSPPVSAEGETRRTAPLAPGAGLRGLHFRPLPGSLREARLVLDIWGQGSSQKHGTHRAEPAIMLTGNAATESALKTLAPGKQVLHLATHGFVLGAGSSAAGSGSRGIHAATPDAALPLANPLQLAGLILAGANRRETAALEQEDGVLIAEEVASLNLQGLDWVVLSGCDTGVGTVQTGEGVLGLRRAFQIAGARSLIMSLWAVSDDAACEWMEALYAARFRDGLGTADAVHAATKAIVEARRRHGQSTHPFYWGGFVAAGDWK